jgi:hypothetical protein
MSHLDAVDELGLAEAAYRRGDLFDKRRKLMAAWATFCMTPAEGAKVIPIGRGSRE